MAKKHCPKHASYYYRCPDCRRLNSEPGAGTPADTGRRLYPDAFDSTGSVRIPVEGQEPPVTPGQPRQVRNAGSPPTGRYYGGYKKAPRSRKKIAIIGLILGAIAVFAILIWAYPAWYGAISLNQQLYMNKAGSFDFWQYYTLNGWSSQFFFNKIGLVSGFIGMALMILPVPDRSILSFIGDWRGRPNPSRAKCYLFWAPVGFGIFYVVGQLMDVVGMFGWGAYLLESGNISGDLTTIGNALQVLFNPGSIDTSFMSIIFAYQYFWLPIINLVFGCIILRIILAMIEYGALKQNYVMTAANGVVLIGLIFGISLFNLPLTSVDGLSQVQNWSVVLGFIGFLCLGTFLLIYGKIRRNVLSFDKGLGKKTILLGAITMVILVIPLLISIPTAIGIDQDQNTWTTERWEKRIQKERAWTSLAAGTNNIVRYPMTNLISGELNKTKDEDLLASMRLFDKTYAFKKMLPQTKTEETLADADIVYLNGVEYWVAPKTIDWVELSQTESPSAEKLHTNLYDHVEGFYAMDTRSNEILSGPQTLSTFNISASYPIFFGENQATETLPSTYTAEDLLGGTYDITWAYDQDIILSTEWGSTSISGYTSNWNSSGGTPDGTLTGLERFWYTANMGLFSYAISQSESTYLINRNVLTRVESILYPGLSVDPDAYLVFDTAEGRLFYAVSIYVDMPIRSFAQSNILRFLGACLVDVKTGTLSFYKNPQFAIAPTSDPTWNFWKIYYDVYAWQTAPAWFMPQFRYPEDLAEAQLAIDYNYHVDVAANWKRGDAWYQRPTNGDLYYIETDLGAGMEFVAVDLVERYGGESKLMAGLYAIRHGAYFGQLVFYDASYLSADPIGPETATTLLTNTATSELTLIGSSNRRDGNVLLYPLAGSVYYLIPVYRTSGTGSATIDELKIVGLVNATDRNIKYGYGAGDLLLTAFNAYNISYQATALSNVSLTSSLASTGYWNGTNTTDADYAQFQFSILYEDLGAIYDQANVTINITMHSNKTMMKVNGELAVNATFAHGEETYTNYTVQTWINLFPGEGRTILAKITADITGFASTSINYDITMYVTNKYGTVTIPDTRIRTLTVVNLAQT